jgi:hypothetical protein
MDGGGGSRGSSRCRATHGVSFVLYNPIRYIDPTGHWPDLWFTWGATTQLLNDMSFGLFYAIGGDPENIDNSSFQSGREAGQEASIKIGAALAINGAENAAAGFSALGPTTALSAACAAGTAGTCSLVGGSTIAGEAVLALGGIAESAYGAGIVAYSSSHPIHHIATNKNWLQGPKWSERFKELFDKGGLDLDDNINKLELPGHTGSHSQAYHQYVYDSLSNSIKGLTDEQEIRAALEAELKALREELIANPDLPNQ